MNRKPARAHFIAIGKTRVSVEGGSVGISGGSVGTTPSAPAFDTGNLLLTAAVTNPIVVDFRARSLYALNLTDEQAQLTVTDGAGTKYADARPLNPRDFVVIPFGGQKFTSGLKWNAGADNTIRAHMTGDPV